MKGPMRVMLGLTALLIGYMAGSSGVFDIASAQEPGGNPNASRGMAPDGRFTDNPRAARNMFMVYGPEEARATLGQARHYTNQHQVTAKGHYEWAPQYRLTSITRQPATPGQEPTHGERHINDTQIYLITGGSGTVLVEGEVADEDVYLVAPSEHRGGPIRNGRRIKVTKGDLVSIPPYTWHVAWGDPGVPLQYTIIHIHTRTDIP